MAAFHEYGQPGQLYSTDDEGAGEILQQRDQHLAHRYGEDEICQGKGEAATNLCPERSQDQCWHHSHGAELLDDEDIGQAGEEPRHAGRKGEPQAPCARAWLQQRQFIATGPNHKQTDWEDDDPVAKGIGAKPYRREGQKAFPV